MPLERLEAQICELAGHLTAATCRFLVLLADFDARRGWASWEMNSCAQWLSWKCQMSSGTAREHVRVARALRDLPVIRAEFAAARLSYAKVRALTRIATPETEEGLAEIAGPMTGNQLERFARARRQVSHADDAAARVRRRLAWRFEDDGSLAGTFRLPPLDGAVLLRALRAAAGALDHPHDPRDGGDGSVPAETPAGDQPSVQASSSLADALLVIAEAFLAGKVAGADDPEVYQVIVHVGTGALAQNDPAVETGSQQPAGVSAETPAACRPVPGDPADPARCHVEDGPAVSVSTAQMLGCTAALSWMLHDRDGTVLDLGRRRRRPSAALRRAARERDKCRCRLYSSRKVSRQDGSTPTIGTPRAAASPRRSTRPAAIRRAWPTSPLDRLARPQQPALSNRTRHPASSRSSMAERPTAGSVKVVNESARKISSPWDTHLAGAGRRRNQRRRFCRWNRVVADHPAERGPVPGRGIRPEHQAVPRAR